MTLLNLLSRWHSVRRGFRQIENLLTQVASEILLLKSLQKVMQLERDLSGPRTGLWMHREKVPQ
jgi:hypothetical protein